MCTRIHVSFYYNHHYCTSSQLSLYNYYSPIEEIIGVVTSFTFQISGIPEGKSCVFISA